MRKALKNVSVSPQPISNDPHIKKEVLAALESVHARVG